MKFILKIEQKGGKPVLSYKKKYKALEKRIADLEVQVQSQQENADIDKISKKIALSLKATLQERNKTYLC
jgi:hypothetical protein